MVSSTRMRLREPKRCNGIDGVDGADGENGQMARMGKMQRRANSSKTITTALPSNVQIATPSPSAVDATATTHTIA